MKKIVIIIAGYNNKDWYERNLASVLSQDYENYRIIYTDDCSTDNTGNLVEEFLIKNDKKNKVKLIKNSKRVGALENIYNMVHSCADDEIIASVDADDHLKHSEVLKKINKAYSENNIWMAWSNYEDSNGGKGCSKAIPPKVIQGNSYRHYHWSSSHLRSILATIFKKIKKEDLLQRDGKFYQTAWDLAFMIPCVEMCAERSMFINEILYVYNTLNPLNDFKLDRTLQETTEREIRAKQKYRRLEHL